MSGAARRRAGRQTSRDPPQPQNPSPDDESYHETEAPLRPSVPDEPQGGRRDLAGDQHPDDALSNQGEKEEHDDMQDIIEQGAAGAATPATSRLTPSDAGATHGGVTQLTELLN